MGQNTRSQAYTISSATPPREYSDFEARILVRVADTSPRRSQEGATGNGANRANAMMMTYKTPAILALRRGDVSTVPFAIFGSLCGIVNSTLRDELTCCSQPSCNRPRRPYSSRDNGRFLLKIYTIAHAVLCPPLLISRERFDLLQTKHLRAEERYAPVLLRPLYNYLYVVDSVHPTILRNRF